MKILHAYMATVQLHLAVVAKCITYVRTNLNMQFCYILFTCQFGIANQHICS